MDKLTSIGINVSSIFPAFSSLFLFIATLLLGVIWKYFNRIPIALKCTLTHLYQDLIAVVLVANWLWYGIVCKSYLNQEDVLLTSNQAKIASIIIVSLQVEFLLTYNVIGVIWLYVIKESILDPPFLWRFDENKTLSAIRCTVITFVTGAISLLCYGGLYPKIFFVLSGDLRLLSELPHGPNIFLLLQGLLSIIPMFSTGISFIYEMKYGQWQSKKRNLAFSILIFTFATCFLVGISCNLRSSEFGPTDFLIIGEALIVLSSIVVPSFLIVNKNFLRVYTRRLLENFISRVKCVIEDSFILKTIYRVFCQQSHRIHPSTNGEV